MADLVGLSQGLNSNTGGVVNTLNTLSDIKNKQEMIALEREKQREQARRWNEEFALTSRMGDADIAYKEQQTAELNQKVQALATQNAELNKQIFTNAVGQQFWGAVQAQDFSLFNTSLAKSEQGQQLLDFIGKQVGGVGTYSTNELLKYNSEDIVRDAVLNPKGYVVLGTQEKRIVPVESFLALTGLSQSYNAQQISQLQQMGRETTLTGANVNALTAQTQEERAKYFAMFENVGNAQQATNLAIGLDKNQATAQQATQKALANQDKIINIPIIRNGNYAGIVSEIQKMSNNNYTQSQLASITTELKQRLFRDVQQLEAQLGRTPTLNDLKARLGKDADVILSVLQANDPIYTNMNKTNDQTRLLDVADVLTHQVTDTISANMLAKRKDGESITDLLDRTVPALKPAYQYLNSVLGGNLESDKQFMANAELQSQGLAFASTFVKYLSGVASRPDEVARTEQIYGSFGKGTLEQLTLLKSFIDRRLREMELQKSKDPASFMLYQGDRLADMQQLYYTLDTLQNVYLLNKSKSRKDKEEADKLLTELHNRTKGYVKSIGLLDKAQATSPVTQTKRASQASNVANLTTGGQKAKPQPTQNTSNLTKEQLNALNKGW